MFLVDANLLIYSSITSSVDHGTAKKWLDDRLRLFATILGLAMMQLATNGNLG